MDKELQAMQSSVTGTKLSLSQVSDGFVLWDYLHFCVQTLEKLGEPHTLKPFLILLVGTTTSQGFLAI